MLVHKVGRDVSVLNDHAEVPGIGFLPVNAFVVHAEQPVVVDTGLSTPDTGFMDALESVIDPRSVRWIWLTHPDRDQIAASLRARSRGHRPERDVNIETGSYPKQTHWSHPLCFVARASSHAPY